MFRIMGLLVNGMACGHEFNLMLRLVLSRNKFTEPLQAGEALPKLPSSGIKSDRDLLVLPGSQVIEDKEMYFGPDPSVYAFVRTATQRNLYRLKLK
jgi:hypothetical protein